jgi:RNA-directed DNA polymerase
VVHCVNKQQAVMLRERIGDRLASVGLTLHPQKTKVVYCKDGKRRARHPVTAFTFLGYDFRARKARSRQGCMFTSFLPAVSKNATKVMNREVRGWRIHLRSNRNLGEIARFINPIVRGWLNYFGAFYRSELFALCARINTYLVRWARKKYRRLGAFKRLHEWWQNVQAVAPRLFYHWSFTRDFLPTGW